VDDAFAGKNILLVDDDRDMLDALCAVLDETGATIRTACDGDVALNVANEFDPDLVVLDEMLPKRSGLLVLEKLKGPGKKRGAKPLVIMITGHSGKRSQVWAERLGVDGYFNKPFRMQRLLDSMQKLFGNDTTEKE
jgi:two-component system alkaline phosphatase synthesis response regulator PhoP